MAFCRNCGHELEDHATVCTNCGVTQVTTPTVVDKGGFLWGLLAAGIVYWMLEKLGKLPAMVVAQVVVYICGCIWFSFYGGNTGVLAAALTCVVPYLIPDAVKLALAYSLANRIGKQVKL